MNANTHEFIDDQPPAGVLTDDARESLRLAIAATPASHPDKAKLTRAEHAAFERRIRTNLEALRQEDGE